MHILHSGARNILLLVSCIGTHVLLIKHNQWQKVRGKKHTHCGAQLKGLILTIELNLLPHQRSPKRHPSISLIPLIMFRPDVKAKRVSLSLFCGEVWKVFAGFLWGLCSWNTQGGSKKDREIAHKRWRDGAQKICVKTEQWWTACHCCNEPLMY